jgi:hypothetical protein
MPGTLKSELVQNDNFHVFENDDGALVIKHRSSDATLQLDETSLRPNVNLDIGDNELLNADTGSGGSGSFDESEISHDGIDQSTVTPDDHHNRDHQSRHGFDDVDELATALRYKPETEPPTPKSGVVRWYDDTEDAFKAKFDDDTSITLGQR